MARYPRQESIPRDFDAAVMRGVVPTLRKVDPHSYDALDLGAANLQEEIAHRGSFFGKDRSVSIVPFKLFTGETLLQAPPTQEIINEVESTKSVLNVMVGGIGLYGSRKTPKLALTLYSEDLREEFTALDRAYWDRGILLNKERFNKDKMYNPHLSFVNLQSLYWNDFASQGVMDRLNVASGIVGQVLTLQAVDPSSYQPI